MAVVLLALVATVVEVEESSAILAIGCGKNTGTWTSSQSSRKTSISSIPTLPGGRRYVGNMLHEMLCNTAGNVLPPSRVAVTQWVVTTELNLFHSLLSYSKKLNNTGGPKQLQ